MVNVNKEQITEACVDIRNNDSENTWAVFTYDESNTICLHKSGKEYDEFLAEFDESDRAYAYVRIETGDELSRRAKFAFITWVGPSVSPLKKAKVSTDKAFVKQVLQNFAVEIQADDKSELQYDHVKSVVQKAGGANYGTGQ
ncbi:coactosin-like protein isoform X2 [Nematostella vectensis]|uniref:coactosin-like protein isoform X2 n=1 Tax=Nematostella vectensis TaxID=45351 RepID=UPI00138FF708|nr:coactosin-like protein isoform X2 [Nematostella vectensis]